MSAGIVTTEWIYATYPVADAGPAGPIAYVLLLLVPALFAAGLRRSRFR